VQSVLSAGHAHGARAANQFEAAAQREAAGRAALQQAEAAAARERGEGAERLQRVEAERDELDALQRRFVKCQPTASAQGQWGGGGAAAAARFGAKLSALNEFPLLLLIVSFFSLAPFSFCCFRWSQVRRRRSVWPSPRSASCNRRTAE